MFHIQELMDDEKCYEKIRALRWPRSRPNACPSCTSNKIVKNGCNNRHPACRRYRCLNCRRRFDDLTATIFSGHHQPLRVWIACMHLMGLDVSNLQIAKELGLNQSDCQQMTHHCHIVETGNASYRFAHSSLEAKSRIKERERSRKAAKAGSAAEVPEPF
jgi:transposase-like protein